MRTTFLLCLATFMLVWAVPVEAQVAWVKYPGNPVLDLGNPGDWDDSRLSPGHIIVDGGTYELWYTGWDGTSGVNFQIGYATSPDGINWTRYAANPVLPKGDPGEWDDQNACQPAVIKEDGTYKMWYTGHPDGCIGYATSVDGISWTKYAGNPVLCPSAGEWDSYAAHWCTVIKDASEYKMWYSGGQDFYSHRIGYATSPDGINWTKYAGNPVLGPQHPGTWDDVQVWFPHVLKLGGAYCMWYGGYDGSRTRIGYASSLDGVSWNVHSNNPILDLGAPGEWDDDSVNEPCVLTNGSEWQMWYQGFEDVGAGTARIGYAEGPASVPAAEGLTLIMLALLLASITAILTVQRWRRFG